MVDMPLKKVTILILVDGFLQYYIFAQNATNPQGHNPYFSRWFSAIKKTIVAFNWDKSHNPYFSRWFSAI